MDDVIHCKYKTYYTLFPNVGKGSPGPALLRLASSPGLTPRDLSQPHPPRPAPRRPVFFARVQGSGFRGQGKSTKSGVRSKEYGVPPATLRESL